MIADINPLSGWLPYSIYQKEDEMMVRLARLERSSLQYNFIDMDLATVKDFREISLDNFLSFDLTPCPAPLLFISHMSRTGSSLMVQMLNSLDDLVIVSEPGVVNQLLSIHTEDEVDLLRRRLDYIFCWYYLALGQHSRVGFKFNSWTALHLDRILDWYPDTPTLFLYRKPLEVLAALIDAPPRSYRRPLFRKAQQSKVRNRGDFVDQLQNGYRGRIDPNNDISYVEYIARFLHELCAASLRESHRIEFMEYTDIKTGVINFVERALNRTLTTTEKRLLADASVKNAKTYDESRDFSSDTKFKALQVTPLMRHMSERYLQPLYDQIAAVNRVK